MGHVQQEASALCIEGGGCDGPMHRWLVPLVRWSKHSMECKQGEDTGLTMAAPSLEGPGSSDASIPSVMKMCLSVWGQSWPLS